jgi:hypothetical protein
MGCPHDDCPQQTEYLADLDRRIDAWHAHQQAEARRIVRESLGSCRNAHLWTQPDPSTRRAAVKVIMPLLPGSSQRSDMANDKWAWRIADALAEAGLLTPDRP